MIHPTTGDFAMIESTYVPQALADGMLVMQGTEDEVSRAANAVRLGVLEQRNRAARRKMQRESRRRNR